MKSASQAWVLTRTPIHAAAARMDVLVWIFQFTLAVQISEREHRDQPLAPSSRVHLVEHSTRSPNFRKAGTKG